MEMQLQCQHQRAEDNIGNATILEQIGCLTDYNASLQKLKEEKIEKFSGVCSEIKSCAELLGLSLSPEYSDLNTGILSDERLEKMKEKSENLNTEKKIREAERDDLIAQCNNLMETVQFVPEGEFDQRIKGGGAAIKLHADDFSCIRQRIEYFQKLVSERQRDVQTFREEASQLYEILDVPSSTQTEFERKVEPMSLSEDAMSEWGAHLQNLRNERKAKLPQIIQNLREKIVKLQDDCHLTATEKRKFTALHTTEESYSETTLILHESEYQKLLALYAEKKVIFDRIAIVEQLLHDRREIASTDTGELMRARSKEARAKLQDVLKKEKNVKTKLPKCKAELQKLLKRWEEQNDGEPFIWNGQVYAEELNKQDADYTKGIEAQKQMKKSSRESEVMKGTASPRTPSKTPSKSMGRASNRRTPQSSTSIRSSMQCQSSGHKKNNHVTFSSRDSQLPAPPSTHLPMSRDENTNSPNLSKRSTNVTIEKGNPFAPSVNSIGNHVSIGQ